MSIDSSLWIHLAIAGSTDYFDMMKFTIINTSIGWKLNNFEEQRCYGWLQIDTVTHKHMHVLILIFPIFSSFYIFP